MRDSTSRCRSLAAWYSAFSRRSPSSRARLISFGSSSFSSWFERLDFVFEFLDQPLFHRVPMGRAIVPQCYPSRSDHHQPPEPARGALPRRPRAATPAASCCSTARIWSPTRSRPAVAFQLAAVTPAPRANATMSARSSAALERAGVDVVTVSAPVMDAVSPVTIAERHRRARPSARRPTATASTPAPAALVVVAVDVQDPGNLGAIVRVAEAARRDRRRRRRRIGRIRSAGRRCAGRWAARCACRSSREISADEAVADARRHGCRIVATVPRGGRSLFDVDLTGPLARAHRRRRPGPAAGARRRRRRARHDPDAGAGRIAERRGDRRADRLRGARASARHATSHEARTS